ncbi:MAG: DUF885 domain-containing protein, partial [Gemmatimonadetes bacterium]|nr:DUF885 domain-containing protein [Gemmatimonadota bacterium]
MTRPLKSAAIILAHARDSGAAGPARMIRGGAATTLAALLLAVLAACSPGDPPGTELDGQYEDLVELFREWREFEAPAFVNGVPDYSEGSMALQHAMLPAMRARLDALNHENWPVSRQIDWHLVRAEMNGLDFDHRVRRPWARDPAFYVMIHAAQSDVPAHEGAVVHGWIDLWTYEYPLSPEDAQELAGRIGAIPGVLEQARTNLTGEAHDLWVAGLRSYRAQSRDLATLAERVAGTSEALDAAITAAGAATDEFHDWLEGEAGLRRAPSGIGRDNYTWYMRNV